ncbi:MAG TPA: hypothetical protein VN906_02135 [Candidatus Sulfotelmatobacter sp.]|nr:hypothetical protein [Candidatus Sulfotelmatobacter sp.]
MDPLRRHLENPDGTAAHPVTTPAEDYGVDSPGQDPPQQHLSLTLVEHKAKNEVHRSRMTVSGIRRQNAGIPVKKL